MIKTVKKGKKFVQIEVYDKYTPKFTPLQPSNSYRRASELDTVKSTPMTYTTACKLEPIQYTGTLIKGIATMHKSNAVPIIDEQHAKDISNMRRN